MRKFVLPLMIVSVALTGLVSIATQAFAEEKKITIKQVMKEHKKGGLLGKVTGGDASDEEKAKLVALYEGLSKATPKKGEADSWKAKTAAILKAAKAGDAGALKKATNCGGCHKLHK